jgi:gamma-glutamyltranspeptidase/glutathione hydrolase
MIQFDSLTALSFQVQSRRQRATFSCRVLFCFTVVGVLVATPQISLFAQQPPKRSSKSDVAYTTGGVVASDSPCASLIGRDVLMKGGNAVDAAVATAFAMAVTWPEAGNIGGGGFMMIAPPASDSGDIADSQVVCIDYRETAPGAVDKNSFLKQTNRCDARMVGVPGTVRGLAAAHKQFGNLEWAELVRPAVDLARNGFVVDHELAKSLNSLLSNEQVQQDVDQLYAETKRTYGQPDGRLWKAGEILKLPDLANTLERISNEGADEFYTGKTAQLLADYMAKSNGFMTAKDLEGYTSLTRKAVATQFKGYQVFGPPPPSSGGITIGLALNMLEHSGFEPESDEVWTAAQIHLIAEAMRRAFRERAAHLGDADFVKIPDFLTDRKAANDFAIKLADTISRTEATPSSEIAGDIDITDGPYESENTTHFSVIDQNGMAVSNTYTLEASWGAKVVAPGTGFVLNNEMGDFNWYPGYTNVNGRIGTDANLLAPHKRMLSSMSPTIVKRDGSVVLVTGSPGGRTIINTVLCILIQHLALERPLDAATEAPRFHHQWFPDQIRIEAREINSDVSKVQGVVSQLKGLGHKVILGPPQGSAHSVSIDPATGVRTGVSDFRRGGRVMVTR